MINRLSFIILLFLIVVTGNTVNATVTLPALFSDHMVLQQQEQVNIWGWAKPNEMITITGSWDSDMVYKTKPNSNGQWSIKVKTPKAGGPYTMVISGQNKIEIKDILIGEVWLGSGQSNMEWTFNRGINDAKIEVKNAKYPEIRLFTVPLVAAPYPQQQTYGEWIVCSPETVENFSTTMYFFGRELHRELNIPVGLVNSSWGGTPIEVWIPEERIGLNKTIRENAELLGAIPWGPHRAGRLYNAMIHPLTDFTIKGVIWYQGESNKRNPEHYALSMQVMVGSWREMWGYDFPFYYVQIAPYRSGDTTKLKGAIVQDQQRRAMSLIDHSGMVVTADIGDLANIHPGNKQDVGKRLAYWALNKDYNQTRVGYSGPLIDKIAVSNSRLTLDFQHNDGLHTYEDDLVFELTKDGEEWYEAYGLIVNDRIIIETPEAHKIMKIRFNFREDAEASLFNKDKLPGSGFQIDVEKQE